MGYGSYYNTIDIQDQKQSPILSPSLITSKWLLGLRQVVCYNNASLPRMLYAGGIGRGWTTSDFVDGLIIALRMDI